MADKKQSYVARKVFDLFSHSVSDLVDGAEGGEGGGITLVAVTINPC